MRRPVGTIAIACTALAILWLTQRHDPDGPFIVMTAGIVFAVILLAYLVPAYGNFVRDHARPLRWLGWIGAFGAIVAGVAGSILFSPEGMQPSKVWIQGGVVGTLICVAIATLANRTWSDQWMIGDWNKAARDVRIETRIKQTSSVDAGWSSIAVTIQGIGILLWLAVPWVVLCWAAPRILVRALLAQHGMAVAFLSPLPTRFDAGFAAAEVVLESLLLFVAIPAFSVAWLSRLNGQTGAIVALPNLRSLRLSLHFWFFLILVGIYNKFLLALAPDIARWIGAKDVGAVREPLAAAVSILVIAFATPFALGWPATAAGDTLERGASLRLAFRSRSAGRRPFLGALVAIVPFALALWAIESAIQQVDDGIVREALSGPLLLTFLFAGVASWSTFIARLYAGSKDGDTGDASIVSSHVSGLP
jgi:hypothetical protein